MQGRVEREIEITAPIQHVWAAISRPDALGSWFGAEVELDLRPDAPVSFRWPDGVLKRGLVEAVEPPRAFAFRWRTIRPVPGGGLDAGDVSRVEFRLEPTSIGTRIIVVESPGILASDPTRSPA